MSWIDYMHDTPLTRARDYTFGVVDDVRLAALSALAHGLSVFVTRLALLRWARRPVTQYSRPPEPDNLGAWPWEN